MRIAILLEGRVSPSPSHGRRPFPPGPALRSRLVALHERGRILVLPGGDPLASRLERAFGTEALAADTLLLEPVPGGLIDHSSWEGLGLSGVSSGPPADVRDEVERTMADASRKLDAGELDAARDAYRATDALLAHDRGPRRAEVLVCLAEIERAQGRLEAAALLYDQALSVAPRHLGALRSRVSIARDLGDPATAAALGARLLARFEAEQERAATLEDIVHDALAAAETALERLVALRPEDHAARLQLAALRDTRAGSPAPPSARAVSPPAPASSPWPSPAAGSAPSPSPAAASTRARASVQVEVQVSAAPAPSMGTDLADRDVPSLDRFELLVRQAPDRPEAYRALLQGCVRARDRDRAFAVASALVHLGVATPDERAVYEMHAPDRFLAPTSAIDELSWELVRPQGYDAAVSDLLLTVAPFAVAARVEQLLDAGLASELDPEQRYDPDASPLPPVRAVGWIARFFGVAVPEVYLVSDELPDGLATLPAARPALAFGRSAHAIARPSEIAFVVGRDLAYLRLTGRVLSFYPTRSELTALLGAAVALGAPGASEPTAEAHALAALLARRLPDEVIARLTQPAEEVATRRGAPDLVRWAQAVELTACRAALLASGDLVVAAQALAAGKRGGGGVSLADRIDDLLTFGVSEAHSLVRRATGVALE